MCDYFVPSLGFFSPSLSLCSCLSRSLQVSAKIGESYCKSLLQSFVNSAPIDDGLQFWIEEDPYPVESIWKNGVIEYLDLHDIKIMMKAFQVEKKEMTDTYS